MVLWNLDLVVRVLVDQIVDLLGVDSTMVVQFLNEVLHVSSNVVVEADICVSLDFGALELFSELFYSVDVFFLLRWLDILDDASSKIRSVYFAFFLFKHLELKTEQLFDYLPSEFNHLLDI